jgi:hypothetical protein
MQLPLPSWNIKSACMDTRYINSIEAIFSVAVLTVHFDITVFGDYIK